MLGYDFEEKTNVFIKSRETVGDQNREAQRNPALRFDEFF